MNSPATIESLKSQLPATDPMPVVFLGHGSPMNAIEDTSFSRAWSKLGQDLPRPNAILIVSAHWMSKGTTLVDISQHPKTIHDFYGFPQQLYQQQYPAAGAPALAETVASLLASHHAQGDTSWGLDHGAWTVLKFLYPEADVPCFQVSIDMSRGLEYQLEIGRTLSVLRTHGVLILGSGNVVHNLSALQFDGSPHDFAVEFDEEFATGLQERDFAALASETEFGSLFRQAHPTADHYLPALTVAGASNDKDRLVFMTESIELGSISMRSFMFVPS